MTEKPILPSAPLHDTGDTQFDVRSVTGACYTIVEESQFRDGVEHLGYRTAYAQLPVEANADGTFTIVDTRTRLVRIPPR